MRFNSLDVRLQPNSVKLEWILDTPEVCSRLSTALSENRANTAIRHFGTYTVHTNFIESWSVISSTRSVLFIPQISPEKNSSISKI